MLMILNLSLKSSFHKQYYKDNFLGLSFQNKYVSNGESIYLFIFIFIFWGESI